MVLVDSSVWIEYLGPHTSRVDQKLEALIRPANQAVITGMIFQEVLQGIRNQRSYQLTRKLLSRFPFLIAGQETHVHAAEIFRSLSSKGRKPTTVDVFIASLAMENKIPLFTLDEDFRLIQSLGLKLF